MGIDNDSKLIFGITFMEDEMNEKLRDVFYNEENIEEDNDRYKVGDLFFGYASPYFDSDVSDRIYFVSISEPSDTTLSIEQITNLLSNWKNTSYFKFLEYCEIEKREPMLISLPHIW